jgi:hypothetical protein
MKITIEASSIEELKFVLEKLTAGVFIEPEIYSLHLSLLGPKQKHELAAAGFTSIKSLKDATDCDLLRAAPSLGKQSLARLRTGLIMMGAA